jgi:Protein of unknown function (DUF4199)
MKKNVLIYGLIAGIVVTIPMLFMANSLYNSKGEAEFAGAELVGYASMLIAFSLVFVGIRNYRDKYNQGVISFGKAFKIGGLIVLLSSTIYVVAWLINCYFFTPDFMQIYADYMLEELKASGASLDTINKQTAEMNTFVELYKNPFFNAAITYTEILPIGLLVTLVSSLILKRKTAKSE